MHCVNYKEQESVHSLCPWLQEVEHFLGLAQEAGFSVLHADDIPVEYLVPDVLVVKMRLVDAERAAQVTDKLLAVTEQVAEQQTSY
jgi:hypothetical protein